MRRMRSSRGVNEARTRVVASRKFDSITASIGSTAPLSSMKSPRCEPSSSPIGVSSDRGSFTVLRTLRTFSSGMPSFPASDAVALGEPHEAAFVADQPLVDVVELLDQRVDARLVEAQRL